LSLSTMIRKSVSCLLILVFFQLALSADWKVEVASFFGPNNNYESAINYLLSHLETISREEKPSAYLLLAYLYERLADRDNQYKWLGQYFDIGRGYKPQLNFLDENTASAVINYLNGWLQKYPLITGLAFIDLKKKEISRLPEAFLLAVHMANPAYYRLAIGKNIVSGGLLNKGLNIINLEASPLLEKTGKHAYFFDVKIDDLVVRKKIEVEVQLKSIFPQKRIEFQMKNRQKKDEVKNLEYKLSMFIGDRLIVSSRKVQPYKLTLKLDIPLTKGKYQPFGPVVDKTSPFNADPLANSVSIPQAIASLVQLLTGKSEKSQQVKKMSLPQEMNQLEITFIRKNAQGIEEKVWARLKLKVTSLKVFAYK